MCLFYLSVGTLLVLGVLADQTLFDFFSHTIHFCPSILSPHRTRALNSLWEPSIQLTYSSHSEECHNPNGRHQSHAPASSPWTQEPLCTAETYSVGEPYCIFTSSTFNNGRGISIFTIPSIAAELSAQPAFTDDQMHGRIDKHSNYPFVQKAIPGKGLGLIATKTLYPGDQIFAYTPATIFIDSIFEDMPVEGEMGRLALQKETVNRLPEETRELWWALLGHFGGPDAADDIINTNSFSESVGRSSTDHVLVLPETARINHDCRPNSQYYFDRSNLTHYVHAITKIQAGEELSISYTDPLTPRADRRRDIEHTWGFDCACSLCTQPLAQTTASDERIAAIIATEELLDDWSSPASRKANGVSPQMAEYVVELYEIERLWAPRVDAYYRAALAWASVGDKWRTSRWAAKGLEFAMLDTGPMSQEAYDLREMERNPEGHWRWRWMYRDEEL